jgi:glycosyltransferase involved in cell wall biosynthesis
MSSAGKSDLIIPVDHESPEVINCVRRSLDLGGEALGRLVVIGGDSLGRPLWHAIEAIAHDDPRVQLIRCAGRSRWVELTNRGLADRTGDVVVLGGGVPATDGWLDKLANVAYSDERTACVAPLNDGQGVCSIREWAEGAPADAIDEATVEAACRTLPLWTTIPTLEGRCVYLKREMIDAVGLLDPGFRSGIDAFCDWAMRAQSLGFEAKRANRVFIQHQAGTRSGNRPDDARSRQQARLYERHPHIEHQVARFWGTLEGRLAAQAVQYQSTGRLRVAYDMRHLPRQQVGTRTYAVGLARELARLSEIELTLLVQDPSQASGLEGRVITPDQWADDVHVIHKPAQIFYQDHLQLLFKSSAHVVITYQDPIAHRISLVFPREADFDSYRATNRLALPAAQRVVVYSESTAVEVTSEFGIPREEVVAVPLGVDVPSFSIQEPGDAAILETLRLPERYFFNVTTDYPHKNRPALLEAYALFRKRWKGGRPPSLIVAGHALNHRAAHTAFPTQRHSVEGVRILGEVSTDQLRVLYQRALALVFPSLYEGFGLPPLEAMAAGTPVIAMPISSVPEVCGDCVLYPEGLSAEHLAAAMERMALSDRLREELRWRGRERVEQFTWQRTARATFAAYRAAVLSPSDRSLQARRLLRDAIVHWSDREPPAPSQITVPIGIRNACHALQGAVRRRLNRELNRLRQPLA